MRYIDAGVTVVRVNPLSGNAASLAERIENKIKSNDFKKTGWMVSIGIFIVFRMIVKIILY